VGDFSCRASLRRPWSASCRLQVSGLAESTTKRIGIHREIMAISDWRRIGRLCAEGAEHRDWLASDEARLDEEHRSSVAGLRGRIALGQKK
jgi:hypothetical protein